LEELPAYIKAFDVCTIPYLVNGFTRSITPLKLMEYLSTGKPVVTTALPAALMYPEVIHIAATHDEFEAHVVDALADPLKGIKERLAVAQENNWDHYMKRKTAIVAAHLKNVEL
jgi:glycosyltransferase involved in cell wall biosynthesis